MQRAGLHHLYPIVALLVLAGVTQWLARVSEPEPERPADGAAGRSDIDYSASNVRLRVHADSGLLQHHITAERAQHLASTDVLLLEEPRMRINRPETTVDIRARAARITPETDNIMLTGDVEVVRRNIVDADDTLVLISDAIEVWPEGERARSHAAVEITRRQDHLRADQLTADNLFGQITLSGHVRTLLPRSTGS